MTDFQKVTVVKKANVYFDGKVTSRTLRFEDGSKKTLGYMLPGEYQFNTDSPEVMEVLGGGCEVLIGNAKEWRKYGAGESFSVPSHSSFKIKTGQGVDYCCSFQ